MSRWIKTLLVAAVLAGTAASPAPVWACPMCKVAQEDSEDPAVAARPKAYMYSILFMLSMPASLFTFFGVSFYRLSKKQQLLNEQAMLESDQIG